MRCLITLSPVKNFSSDVVYKHNIQGLIYNLLNKIEYSWLHESKHFKFFCFSDIFPSGDFIIGKEKHLIVSSPSSKFINDLYYSIRQKNEIRLGNNPLRITKVKKIKLKLKNRFITGSPVVLYKDNKKNIYFSFKRDSDFNFFLKRLKENAVKKFNAFYDDDYNLEEELFDKLQFNKEVVVKNRKRDKEFIVIGSMWKLLEKFSIDHQDKKFYRFIMDAGLGEKNSFGFGFVNPIP